MFMSFEKQAIRAATSVSATLPYDLARFLKGPPVAIDPDEAVAGHRGTHLNTDGRWRSTEVALVIT
jgi:hypothetical protein